MVNWRLLLRLVVFQPAQGVARGRPISACRTALLDGHALLRDRLWPNERRAFAGMRRHIRARRDTLYLQVDHTRHLHPYRHTIASESRQRKGAFAAFCTTMDLPHPTTVVLDTRRHPEQIALAEQLPAHALFIKAEAGSNGRGAAILRKIAADRWELHAADRVAQGTIAQLLTAHCPSEAIVVQPRLVNAAGLAQWAGDTLVTFRIVTGRRANGAIETLSMLAELPLDDVEPLGSRWAIFPVRPSDDLLSGTAAAKVAASSQLATHVGMFEGRHIEFADELRSVAVRAHAKLAETATKTLPPMIGWDVAWIESGAVLLEFNWNWAVVPHYMNTAGLDFSLSNAFLKFSR